MTPAIAISDLLAPIPGELPGGTSLRYDPVYDKIKEARRIDDGGAVVEGKAKEADYGTVIRLGTEALATRSKDLQLAVWLADAFIGRDGFGGLLRGLEVLRGLIDNYWETLHPEIEDGDVYARSSLLGWYGNYMELAKGTSPVRSVRLVPLTASGLNWIQYKESQEKQEIGKTTAKDFDIAFDATPKAFYKTCDAELSASRESLRALEAACDERFGREGPSFRTLLETLEEIHISVGGLLRRKLEKEPDPAEPAVQVAASGDAFAADNPDTSGYSTNFDLNHTFGVEPKTLQAALEHIVGCANYLRRQLPSNPASYMVLRAVRWGELRAQPRELNAALLIAPVAETRTRLKSLATAGRWADVLECAEQAMATECGRAWLDVQRYAVTACDKLGYDAVAAAIRSELKCLLSDYSALSTATLLDDTGAANPETSAWLSDGMKSKD